MGPGGWDHGVRETSPGTMEPMKLVRWDVGGGTLKVGGWDLEWGAGTLRAGALKVGTLESKLQFPGPTSEVPQYQSLGLHTPTFKVPVLTSDCTSLGP